MIERKNYIVTTKFWSNVHNCYRCREYWYDGYNETDVRNQAENEGLLGEIIDIIQTDRDTEEDYDYE